MTYKRTRPFLIRTALGMLCNTEGDTGGGGTGSDGGDGKAGEDKGRAERTAEEKGYPADTPTERMTADQRANYWSDQAKKHEAMLKAERRSLGNLTADELKSLRDKATRHDALERELMSDKDKGIAEARAEEAAKAVPRVVRAEFKAAAKDVLTADQLNALLEDRDLSKYANANGEPDETKIENLVKAFAPAKTTTRTGPSATGLGSHQPSGGAGDQGRAMAAKRFGTKTS